MSDTTPTVEFWFDPICPWCWMTSRWAAEVAETRGFDITWHPVSLAIINEGNIDNGHAEAYRESMRMLRVVEAVRIEHGQEKVGPMYTALGNRIHPGQQTDTDSIILESLDEVGLESTLLEAGENESYDTQLRRNTEHALKIAGPGVGVPVISIDGTAFFGPVVTPAPTGERALQLWDGIYAAASVPGFFELKRGRNAGPQF